MTSDPLLQSTAAADELAASTAVTTMSSYIQGLSGQVVALMQSLQVSVQRGVTFQGASSPAEPTEADRRQSAVAERIVEKVARESEAERELLLAKVSEQAAVTERQAVARRAARQSELDALLARNAGASEDERKRLIREFEEEHAAVESALELERQRQRADMVARLEARKKERYDKQLRLAEAQAAKVLQERHAVESRKLEEEQQAQMQALEQELEAERKRRMTAIVGASPEEDVGFEAERELNALRSKASDDVADSVRKAVLAGVGSVDEFMRELAAEGTKRRRSLRERLEKDLASLPAGDASRTALLEQYQAEIDRLRAEEAVQLQRKVASLEAVTRSVTAPLQQQLEQRASTVQELKDGIEDEHDDKLFRLQSALGKEEKAQLDDLRRQHAAALEQVDPAGRPPMLRQQATEEAELTLKLFVDGQRRHRELDEAAVAASAQLDAALVQAEVTKLQAALCASVAELEVKQQGKRDADAEALRRQQLDRRELELLRQSEEHFAQQLGADPASLDALLRLQAQDRIRLEESLDAKDEQEMEGLRVASAATDAQLMRQIKSLRTSYEKDVAAVQDRLSSERAKQQQALQQRLAARVQLRQDALRKKHAEDVLRSFGDADKSLLEAQQAKQLATVQSLLNDDASRLREAYRGQAEMMAGAITAANRCTDLVVSQVQNNCSVLSDTRWEASVQVNSEARDRVSELQARVDEARSAFAEALLTAGGDDLDVLSAHQRLGEGLDAVWSEATDDDSRLEVRVKMQASQRAAQTALALSASDSRVQQELEAIKEAHERDVDSLLARMQDEKRRQRANLDRQLALRESRKRREVQRALEASAATLAATQAKQLANLEVDPAELPTAASSNDASWEANVLQAVQVEQSVIAGSASVGLGRDSGIRDSITDAEATLQAVHMEEAQMLSRKHEEEQKRVEQEAAREAAELARKAAAELAAAKQQALEAKRAELEASVAARNVRTHEEFERLKAQFSEEAQQYAEAVGDERQRQNAKLQERLAAKRDKQRRALQRQQEAEREALALQQARTAAETKAAQELELEQQALRRVLESGALLGAADAVPSEDVVGEAVETVLKQRHMREMSDLLAAQYGERTSVLRRALEDFFDARRDEQAELRRGMEDEGYPEAQIANALLDAKGKVPELQAALEKSVLSELEVKHAREQLEVRQRHLAELATSYQRLAPQDVLRNAEAEQAMKEAEELREFQERMEKERVERLEQLRRERASMEERLRLENEAEIRRLEEEHANQIAAETQRTEAVLRRQREKLEREQAELEARRLKEAGVLDLEERDKIKQEFEMNRKAQEESLRAERARQSDNLKRRLQQRAEKQRIAQKRELARRMQEQELKDQEEVAKATAEATKKFNMQRLKSAAKMVLANSRGNSLRDLVQSLQSVRSTTSLTQSLSLTGTQSEGALQRGIGASARVKFAAAAKSAVESSVRSGAGSDVTSFAAPGRAGSFSMRLSNPITPSNGGAPPPAIIASLTRRLEGIESLIEQLSKRMRSAQPGVVSAAAMTSSVHVPEPQAQATLQLASMLPSEQLRVVQFCQQVCEAVRSAVAPSAPALSVTAATGLPRNSSSAQSATFKGPFHWDAGQRRLCLHVDCLRDIADAVPVLLHCLAHVFVGGSSFQDTLPEFPTKYQAVFRAYNQFMFKQSFTRPGAGVDEMEDVGDDE